MIRGNIKSLHLFNTIGADAKHGPRVDLIDSSLNGRSEIRCEVVVEIPFMDGLAESGMQEPCRHWEPSGPYQPHHTQQRVRSVV